MYLDINSKEEPYSDDCALCQEFMVDPDELTSEQYNWLLENEFSEDDIVDDNWCFGCPVFMKTGNHLCNNTPWREAKNAWNLRHDYPDKWREEALKEIAFLVDLLPEPEERY
jgi:hypothetical protein